MVGGQIEGSNESTKGTNRSKEMSVTCLDFLDAKGPLENSDSVRLVVTRVKKGSETALFWLGLAGTEGQRVGLATLCPAREGPLLAQRVDSVPADFPVPWHGGGGSIKHEEFAWRAVDARGPSKPGGRACFAAAAQRLSGRHDGPGAPCSRASGRLIERSSWKSCSSSCGPSGGHVGWTAAAR